MITFTEVGSEHELEEILRLQQLNHRDKIQIEEMRSEGFVTMKYSLDELRQMHKLAPSIIAKAEDKVIAYALTVLKEGQKIVPSFNSFINRLEGLMYKGQLLYSQSFYFMGQVCIAKDYRGQGIFDKLYNHHKALFQSKFDFLITEISKKNIRSQKAHERVGFKTFDSYSDEIDDWNIVIWDWS